MFPLTSKAKLALYLATAVVCFGLGYRQHGLEDAKEQAQNLSRMANARRKQEEQDAKKAAHLEGELATLARHNRELNRRLAHETTKPEYRCVLPADGLRLRSDALADPAGEHDRPVPGAD